MNLTLFFSLCLVLHHHHAYAKIWRNNDGVRGDFTVVSVGRLDGSVVVRFGGVDLSGCTIYCVQHVACKTVNFNWDTHMCELNSGRVDEGDIVDVETRWRHYDTPDVSIYV